ncbi:hypothetical protein [Neobacillus drentensis]|uniref:hypothetical protein n=1 Tax=Neobacillus drentensis TaxID=220684 RepID=UPI0008263E6C|nr:hypothetical protein [Neobacillus drentensis]
MQSSQHASSPYYFCRLILSVKSEDDEVDKISKKFHYKDPVLFLPLFLYEKVKSMYVTNEFKSVLKANRNGGKLPFWWERMNNPSI